MMNENLVQSNENNFTEENNLKAPDLDQTNEAAVTPEVIPSMEDYKEEIASSF